LQIIEFPNFLQRTHKLYVDWDKKLSDMERLPTDTSEGFLPHRPNTQGYGVIERRANVEKIRQLALKTPCAIVRLLEKMGCQFLFGDDGATIKVYVKEGTRPTAAAAATEGDEGGMADWKISFHFVFQVRHND
jgi:hypothetical protein